MKTKKLPIYLTEEQCKTVTDMEKNGHGDILKSYTSQGYEYGFNAGKNVGIVGSALALLTGFGAAKLAAYLGKRTKKK